MRLNLLAGVAPVAVAVALGLGVTAASAQPMMNGIQTGTGKLEHGKQAGDFMIRLRGIAIVPDDRARIDTIGGNTEISNEYVPET
jgi:outer membrane protein